MKTFLITAAAVAAVLAGCATTPATETPTPTTAEIVRDGEVWTLTYRLNADAPVWVMRRSALARWTEKPWRPEQWTVETPGVRLERRGAHDMLVAESGIVPREVRIRMAPKLTPLLADYDPALTFYDGSMVALYSGHFDLFPMEDLGAAEALPADLNGAEIPGETPQMGFVDRAGPVLFKGERRGRVDTNDDGAYVMFGALEVGGNEAVAEAAERNEHRTHYACGAVFAMAAEAAQKRATGGDGFDFLKPLIDDNREDRGLTRDEWLMHLTAVAGGAAPRDLIEGLLDTGSADPTAAIADLFRMTGVAFAITDGRVVLTS